MSEGPRRARTQLAAGARRPDATSCARRSTTSSTTRRTPRRAFFVSPFDEAAVLTLDGFGDFASAMLAVGRGNRLEVLDRVLVPALARHLLHGRHAVARLPEVRRRVQGDGPRAVRRRRTLHREQMRDLVRLDGPASSSNLDYFTHHDAGRRHDVDERRADDRPRSSRRGSRRSFGPAREPRGELTKHHEDVAGALQAVLEEAYLHVVNAAQRRTGSTNLCLAGGVALNAVANGRIRPRDAVRRASTSSPRPATAASPSAPRTTSGTRCSARRAAS